MGGDSRIQTAPRRSHTYQRSGTSAIQFVRNGGPVLSFKWYLHERSHQIDAQQERR